MSWAACHTADNRLAPNFDVRPWFREADPESILRLAEKSRSGVWVADALETRPGYQDLRWLREELLEDPTWPTLACLLNQSDAMDWLAQKRPEVAAKLQDQPIATRVIQAEIPDRSNIKIVRGSMQRSG